MFSNGYPFFFKKIIKNIEFTLKRMNNFGAFACLLTIDLISSLLFKDIEND